jgi:hypothetical protein
MKVVNYILVLKYIITDAIHVKYFMLNCLSIIHSNDDDKLSL